ncbi:MAG TPA: transferrin receptor-like dimerization domain-containing protein [Candidatus Binataceae bacterium]|nr:transferrin receptor-like dimerization domain-containing protein [Candidatus Binataceae bacterium]
MGRLTKYPSTLIAVTIAIAIFVHAAVRFSAAAEDVGRAAPTPAPSDEAQLEHSFDAAISPNDLRDWMKVLASEPNQVGSPHNKANAERILGWFKDFGWDSHIETFDVLYPTPISETLELTAPKPFKATLQEPPIAGDSSATATDYALPAYVEYARDGDVTAGLVYVNYGMQDDYLMLERLGVSVTGKIAIARYGKGWRGVKPKLAQDHGAVGCIIYSDPAEDGYAVDDTYPAGPMRPSAGVQRGSVLDFSFYPGDPLTPGIGATKDAKRLQIADAPTIIKIPTVPISYGDAQVFLASMQGPVAPASWRGALPITYHVGPGPATAHLAIKSDWSLKEIYDVVATMKGATYPDQWIVRGNHHDGWVFGATDPISGQVALLAEAKAMGALAKNGWRPNRTIVYTSWDGEEPMLLGSTEWAEAHASELKKNAVLYINSDSNARGFLEAGGSQDLAHLVNDVANDVIDPETKVSIGQRLRAKIRVAALDAGASERLKAEAKLAADASKDLPIEALGSGSDFSAYLDHLGIATLDLGFGEEGEGRGVYHSRYDTFEHHTRFVDPGFVYDALLAKTIGRMVIRAADNALPLQRAGDFADAISEDLDQVKKLADQKRDEAETQAKLLHDRAFQLAADPTKSSGVPAGLDRVPHIEFAVLDDAVDHLKRSAKAYDDALSKNGANLDAARMSHLQTLMLTIDQTLAPDVGLPGRPWYKNLVYAPGRFSGYGAKTLPGVREAIEDRRWADADRYAKLTADALNAYSDRLDQATAVLSSPSA